MFSYDCGEDFYKKGR